MAIKPNEFWRKSIHGAGILFIPILWWNRDAFAVLLASFLAAYLATEFCLKKGIRIPLLTTLTEKSKRDSERNRLSRGALCLAGVGIVLPYLFGIPAAAIGLSQTFVADTVAALVGMSLRGPKLPYHPQKTISGFLGFLLSAFFVSLLFVPWEKALILALIGALIESLPIGDWDNLAIPLIVSAAAFYVFPG